MAKVKAKGATKVKRKYKTAAWTRGGTLTVA